MQINALNENMVKISAKLVEMKTAPATVTGVNRLCTSSLHVMFPGKPEGLLGKDSLASRVLVHVPDPTAFDRHLDAGAVAVAGAGYSQKMLAGARARVDPLPLTGRRFYARHGTALWHGQVMINCPERPAVQGLFAGRVLDQWAYWHGIKLDFSRPGKPTDNAYIEAFNARLRAKCLNASWFLSMHDASDRIENWRQDYNTARPHSALGNLTPRAFARQVHEARKIA